MWMVMFLIQWMVPEPKKRKQRKQVGNNGESKPLLPFSINPEDEDQLMEKEVALLREKTQEEKKELTKLRAKLREYKTTNKELEKKVQENPSAVNKKKRSFFQRIFGKKKKKTDKDQNFGTAKGKE